VGEAELRECRVGGAGRQPQGRGHVRVDGAERQPVADAAGHDLAGQPGAEGGVEVGHQVIEVVVRGGGGRGQRDGRRRPAGQRQGEGRVGRDPAVGRAGADRLPVGGVRRQGGVGRHFATGGGGEGEGRDGGQTRPRG